VPIREQQGGEADIVGRIQDFIEEEVMPLDGYIPFSKTFIENPEDNRLVGSRAIILLD